MEPTCNIQITSILTGGIMAIPTVGWYQNTRPMAACLLQLTTGTVYFCHFSAKGLYLWYLCCILKESKKKTRFFCYQEGLQFVKDFWFKSVEPERRIDNSVYLDWIKIWGLTLSSYLWNFTGKHCSDGQCVR